MEHDDAPAEMYDTYDTYGVATLETVAAHMDAEGDDTSIVDLRTFNRTLATYTNYRDDVLWFAAWVAQNVAAARSRVRRSTRISDPWRSMQTWYAARTDRKLGDRTAVVARLSIVFDATHLDLPLASRGPSAGFPLRSAAAFLRARRVAATIGVAVATFERALELARATAEAVREDVRSVALLTESAEAADRASNALDRANAELDRLRLDLEAKERETRAWHGRCDEWSRKADDALARARRTQDTGALSAVPAPPPMPPARSSELTDNVSMLARALQEAKLRATKVERTIRVEKKTFAEKTAGFTPSAIDLARIIEQLKPASERELGAIRELPEDDARASHTLADSLRRSFVLEMARIRTVTDPSSDDDDDDDMEAPIGQKRRFSPFVRLVLSQLD